MTTKEEIKSLFENPQGNPYSKNNKHLNMNQSLFPLKQKMSLLDIFKKGFLNFFPSSEEDDLTLQKNNDSKEMKEKPNNNGINSVSINNFVKNINDEKNNNEINEEIKTNEKEDTEISMTLNEETNINSNSKGHKKGLSSVSPHINQELIENNILNEKMNRKENENDIVKDKYSNSSNVTQEGGGEEINSNRKNSVRVSDCSENVTNFSLERKIHCFKTNFEEEKGNYDIKNNMQNYDNNI